MGYISKEEYRKQIDEIIDLLDDMNYDDFNYSDDDNDDFEM